MVLIHFKCSSIYGHIAYSPIYDHTEYLKRLLYAGLNTLAYLLMIWYLYKLKTYEELKIVKIASGVYLPHIIYTPTHTKICCMETDPCNEL